MGNNRARRKVPSVKQAAARVQKSPPKVSIDLLGNSEEVRVFLSYSHDDEKVYRMVGPFKKLLEHFVYAKSKKRIVTFLDQDSIGWGEIWRDRLSIEVLSATVFIPLLSANYLDSINCRSEFNKFQSSATALGVNELLLPVLVINATEIFNESSLDDVVREASSRQWENIEEAVLSDLGSSQWKRTMAHLADRFVRTYQLAEDRIADRTAYMSEDVGVNSNDDELDDDDVDRPGLAEISESLHGNFASLTLAAQEITAAITELGEAASNLGELPVNPSSRQIMNWSITASLKLTGPSENISTVGENMLTVAKDLDRDVQSLRGVAMELPSEFGLIDSLNEGLSRAGDLDQVGGELRRLLDALKPAEVLSVPLRRALRPARRGLTRVTDSLGLMKAWSDVDNQARKP